MSSHFEVIQGHSRSFKVIVNLQYNDEKRYWVVGRENDYLFILLMRVIVKSLCEKINGFNTQQIPIIVL